MNLMMLNVISKRMFGATSAATARVPLIKFIGKREKKAIDLSKAIKQEIKKEILATPAPVPKVGKNPKFQPKPRKPHTPNAVDLYTLKDGSWHGRLKLTKQEIEAINSGGV
jgi:hypothetical protein